MLLVLSWISSRFSDLLLICLEPLLVFFSVNIKPFYLNYDMNCSFSYGSKLLKRATGSFILRFELLIWANCSFFSILAIRQTFYDICSLMYSQTDCFSLIWIASKSFYLLLSSFILIILNSNYYVNWVFWVNFLCNYRIYSSKQWLVCTYLLDTFYFFSLIVALISSICYYFPASFTYKYSFCFLIFTNI